MPAKNLIEFRFQILSSTHYLPLIRQVMPAIAKDLKNKKRIPEKVVIRCSMALVEAVDNAIFHAHKGKTSKAIGIDIAIYDNTIVMKVSDHGRGYDLNSVPEPEDIFQTSGRGLFVIKEIMDEVEYDNNVLRMIKKIR